MAAERVKSMYSTASDTPITLDPALLAKGAEVTDADKDRVLPIHYAAIHGRYDALKLLLDEGARVDAQHVPTGASALMYAAQYGNCEIISLLLDRGANVYLPDRMKLTAEAYAYRDVKIEALEMLEAAREKLEGDRFIRYDPYYH